MKDDYLLEGAFDGRGCDFKVLVSSSVHPLVGGDPQSCDLRKVKKKKKKKKRSANAEKLRCTTKVTWEVSYLSIQT